MNKKILFLSLLCTVQAPSLFSMWGGDDHAQGDGNNQGIEPFNQIGAQANEAPVDMQDGAQVNAPQPAEDARLRILYNPPNNNPGGLEPQNLVVPDELIEGLLDYVLRGENAIWGANQSLALRMANQGFALPLFYSPQNLQTFLEQKPIVKNAINFLRPLIFANMNTIMQTPENNENPVQRISLGSIINNAVSSYS